MRVQYHLSLSLAGMASVLLGTQVESRFVKPKPLVKTIPTTPTNHPVEVQFTSSTHSFDAPKLSAVNGTAGQWWYFDVVSTRKEHVVVVFFAATNTSFPPLGPVPGVDIVSLSGSFANGTDFEYVFGGPEAVITTVEDGASGSWKDTGLSFSGAPDLSRYVVDIDSPETGIKGSIVLNSVAPAHYPCNPAGAGHDMRVTPYLGWANALPDADATVDLHVDGTHLSFDGAGYHDQNWSSAPVFAGVASWYWGHAHLGPYSVVFSNIVGLDGKTKDRTYVAKAGKIVAIDCEHSTTRPIGHNSQYPPTSKDGVPSGFKVTIDLGKEGELEVDLTTRSVVVEDPGFYYRMLSDVSGGIKGSKQRWIGTALNEEFTIV